MNNAGPNTIFRIVWPGAVNLWCLNVNNVVWWMIKRKIISKSDTYPTFKKPTTILYDFFPNNKFSWIIREYKSEDTIVSFTGYSSLLYSLKKSRISDPVVITDFEKKVFLHQCELMLVLAWVMEGYDTLKKLISYTGLSSNSLKIALTWLILYNRIEFKNNIFAAVWRSDKHLKDDNLKTN